MDNRTVQIEIDPDQLARAIERSAAELPNEACGLLLGTDHGDGRVVVERVEPTRNATREPAADTFEVHPEDFVRLDGLARELGLDVVGVWHSHPDSAAIPSRTDTERAWPGWSYLIVGRAAHSDVHARSWRLDATARFAEERLLAPRGAVAVAS
ncbi:Mov34/MPN/PAD-1 family protein [Planctomycetes bacterium Pla163]|uniref:Mov34/MPN/PAD-1 family protein n=1 Tax=Rohdeia mirabilis TaxID=2528008 RepID=A0A518CWM8_9BACT|nr:Mov34/MPN/PAD-1 family protein [Planctomycetes bacterium Pla163]